MIPAATAPSLVPLPFAPPKRLLQGGLGLGLRLGPPIRTTTFENCFTLWKLEKNPKAPLHLTGAFPTDLNSLSSAMGQITSITQLTLERINLENSEAARSFCDSLGKLSDLSSLKIQDTAVEESLVNPVIQAIGRLNLWGLELVNVQLEGENANLDPLSNLLSRLTFLNLAQSNFLSKDLKVILVAIRAENSLRRLVLDGVPVTQDEETFEELLTTLQKVKLAHLELNHCHVSDTALSRLASLECFDALQSLSLCNNSLGARGLADLDDAINQGYPCKVNFDSKQKQNGDIKGAISNIGQQTENLEKNGRSLFKLCSSLLIQSLLLELPLDPSEGSAESSVCGLEPSDESAEKSIDIEPSEVSAERPAGDNSVA
jgi:hypothetical protein